MQEYEKQVHNSSAGDNMEGGEYGGESRPLLSDLFWRDEILQMMYWYQGEGFGTEIAARELRTFLTAIDEEAIGGHLEQMVKAGFLQRHSQGDVPHYSFTEFGAREGARRFADEFADITKQGHGDCPPNCPICKDLPPEDCVHCRSIASEVRL
ncbi:MAG: hypothetical protein IVW55_09070 [Chloroflexi bacterium]|nr:hypothetical protein [Chloroflexota bacterium]